MMQVLQHEQFSRLINEVFSSVIDRHGFKLRSEKEYLLIARKGDIELLFRLEIGYQSHYFSLEIRLSGELGERATSDSRYRHLGVSAIAKCFEPNYQESDKGAETEEMLREMMELQKEELLKYCEDILAGDVSSWSKVVDCLKT
jgi:hypothetical protein